MNELCLFIKDNIWQLIIILTMVTHPHYRKLGLLLTLLTLVMGYRAWIYIGIILFGIFIDASHTIINKNKSNDNPKRKDPDYE